MGPVVPHVDVEPPKCETVMTGDGDRRSSFSTRRRSRVAMLSPTRAGSGRAASRAAAPTSRSIAARHC